MTKLSPAPSQSRLKPLVRILVEKSRNGNVTKVIPLLSWSVIVDFFAGLARIIHNKSDSTALKPRLNNSAFSKRFVDLLKKL